MFKLKYRIAKEDYIDFLGDKGYYKIFYNNNVYGHLYPEDGINFEGMSQEEIEDIMGTELLYNWFLLIIQVAIELHSKTYVALGDLESSTRWLEFEKKKDDLIIQDVLADAINGMTNIEYELQNKKYEISENRYTPVSFQDFKQEIIEKCTSYLKDISKLEQNDYGKAQIANLEEKLKYLKSL